MRLLKKTFLLMLLMLLSCSFVFGQEPDEKPEEKPEEVIRPVFIDTKEQKTQVKVSEFEEEKKAKPDTRESLFDLGSISSKSKEDILPRFDCQNVKFVPGDPTTVYFFLGSVRFQDGNLTINADSAVVWQTKQKKLKKDGDSKDGYNYEIYLEGNVMVFDRNIKTTPEVKSTTPVDKSIFTVDELLDVMETSSEKERKARRNVLVADRVYFNIGTRSGLISSKKPKEIGRQKAKMIYYLEDRNIPLVIKAEKIRLSGGVALKADYAEMTNTSHPDAGLQILSRKLYYVDTGTTRRITAEHNRMKAYILRIPIPSFTKDLNERGMIIKKVQYGENKTVGHYIKTILDMQSEGIFDEDWLTWNMQVDYYQHRGPAMGIYGRYYFGNSRGNFQVYHLWDNQQSAWEFGRHLDEVDTRTGALYAPNPIRRNRGLISLRHRTEDIFEETQLALSYPFFRDIRFDFEFYWESDEFFVPEFKPKQFFEDKEKENYVLFRKVYLGRDVYTLLFKYRINDHFTKTEYLPKLKYSRTYGPLNKDLGLNYAFSVSLDNVRRRQKDMSTTTGYRAGRIIEVRDPQQYILAGRMHRLQQAYRVDINLDLERPFMFAKTRDGGMSFLNPGETPEGYEVHFRPWILPRLTYYKSDNPVSPFGRRAWDQDGNTKIRKDVTDANGDFDDARFSLTLGGDVSTSFSRTFPEVSINTKYLKVSGLRHVIEPIISYRNTIYTNYEPQELVFFDEVDNVDNYERVSFALRQRLDTKTSSGSIRKLAEWEMDIDAFPTASRDNRRMARHMSGSDRFPLSRPTNTYIKNGRDSRGNDTYTRVQEARMGRSPKAVDFSALHQELNFYPTPDITIGTELYYNTYNGFLEDGRFSLSQTISRNLSYTVGYSTHADQGAASWYQINQEDRYVLQGPSSADNTYHIIDGTITRRLNKKYSIQLFGRYDFEIQRNIRHGLFVTRNFAGWSLDIGYERNAGILRTSEEQLWTVTVRPNGQDVVNGKWSEKIRPNAPDRDF